jgi:PadR family transcriptional regulator PadR
MTMNRVRTSAPISSRPYVTRTFLDVLEAFLESNPVPLTGAAICRSKGMATGTVYPMLVRLQQRGWLTSELEDIDPKIAGRPQRRFYRLSTRGYAEGLKILRERDEARTETASHAGQAANPAGVLAG